MTRRRNDIAALIAENLSDPRVWLAALAAYAVVRPQARDWPSANARAASNSMRHTAYVGGGPWDASQCFTAPTIAARLLGDSIRSHFDGTSVHYTRCSPLGSQMSIHAVGRALDVSPPSATIGDEIANWCVENASTYDIQLVIWNQLVWQPSRSLATRFADYTGPNPHTDHVHVEVSA